MLFATTLLVAEPAKILPLYFLLALLNSSRTAYASVTGRPVPVSVVKAMIVSTCAIYGLSTVLLCVPALRQTAESHATTSWGFSLIFIFALIQYLAIKSPAEHESQPTTEKEYMKVYLNKDYPPLMALYRIILALSVLGGVFVLVSPTNQHLITANVIAHCLQSTFELRKLGYATTRQAISAALTILLGTKMVGPVAVYAGMWYWRENVIHGLSK